MKLSVKVDSQTFEVEIHDLTTRPILATVDGETFEIWPDEAAVPAALKPVIVEEPPLPASTAIQHAPVLSIAEKTKRVAAPIPGVILSVQVKAGDTVVFGQELCVLEAMKMKNQIRANRAGKIETVRVSPGDQIRHGQVLIEFAD